MKTIEEASNEYAQITGHKYNDSIKIYDSYDISSAFSNGVEFAQRWIPIEEELPEFTTDSIHNPVIVKFKTIHGDVKECVAVLVKIPQHCFENSPYHNTWYVYPSGGHKLRNVISWSQLNTSNLQ